MSLLGGSLWAEVDRSQIITSFCCSIRHCYLFKITLRHRVFFLHVFWECPVVMDLWTHVDLVLSSSLRTDCFADTCVSS